MKLAIEPNASLTLKSTLAKLLTGGICLVFKTLCLSETIINQRNEAERRNTFRK
jgi:hypothetical protein